MNNNDSNDSSYFNPIGHRQVWGGQQPFGLFRHDRRHHLYVVGKTGSGKTTALRNMILADIAAGQGIGFIDPHGDAAEDILDHIPPWRCNDVIYFRPFDNEYPVALNLLDASTETRHLVPSMIISCMKGVWRDFFGPRMEHILYATVAALSESENTSILGIPRMLTDQRYRERVLRRVTNPMVRAFWLSEFAGYDKRFRTEAVAPIQNKVGQLLMADSVRQIFGQVRSTIRPSFIMDSGKIFIANLSKGQLGEDKANLIGAVLLSQFQLAAMARASIPEAQRRDFFLFVDEFHNFSTDTFVSVLAETRKYRLCLTLANQYIDQASNEVREAVFGNVGSIVSFRVGETDAARLAREFGYDYSAQQFTDLGNYEVCAKILVHGQHGEPFMGKTLPPAAPRYGRREQLIALSRQRYGTRRHVVEDRLKRWLGDS